MKNTFGNNISLTLFGESHGPAIGAVLDGLPPGLTVNEEQIHHQLTLRRPSGELSTPRVERDEIRIISGVWAGKTTGTPLCLVIENSDTQSKDYAEMRTKARPGHADFATHAKYHGFQDVRGGGHFSGRLTAAVVAACAILVAALRAKGITIGTHISRCGGVDDRGFNDLASDIELLGGKAFAVLDDTAGAAMQQAILAAKAAKDSVGGVLETAVYGLPAGLGEPWFDSMESQLAHALFAIPAVKGVEFGDGFGLCDLRGSQANDAFAMENGRVITLTNHNGGLNGGLTNGMPLLFKCAVKPTSTIGQTQRTVDLQALQDTTITAAGRHDPCIVHRARVVVDSLTALVLCDALTGRFGTDFLA